MEMECQPGYPERQRRIGRIKPPTSSVSKFLEGASAPWLGFKFLTEHPSLWRYAILPILVNLLITALALFLLVAAASWCITYVHPKFAGDEEGVWWWLTIGGEIVFAVLLIVLSLAVTVLVWMVMSGVLCGYVYGILAGAR